MNERIKELVRQAGGHFSTHTLTSYPAQHRESIELWDKNIEKFAESIVKECMTIAQEYDGAKLGGPGLIIAMRIEQHFGVEE